MVKALTFNRILKTKEIDTYFAVQESKYNDITPGTQKRVIWAERAGRKTDVAVVYIHGFSATSEEIRPVPDLVAKALKANLVYTRLTGHGRGGPAMAEATIKDWMNDTAEAIAVARAAGTEVIVIATSTGGTLAALAALDPNMSKNIKGITFVSPNFELANKAAKVLTWPGVRWWGPLIAGRERSFPALSKAHSKYWTIKYPSIAVAPMAKLVKHCFAQDFSRTKIPTLFLYAATDKVVSARATKQIAKRWGGTAKLAPQRIPKGNDVNHHVIAGDILSPGMTALAAQTILDWADTL